MNPEMSFQALNPSYMLTFLFSKHGLRPKGATKSQLYFLSSHRRIFSQP